MLEDFKTKVGDRVIFIKNKNGNWALMSVKKLAEKIIELSNDTPSENLGKASEKA
ncbi:MAG: hypothetical protein QFX38_07325 [Methanothermobacter sp.]|nr:hypothetical protein [Methanothermobacter sp.]